MSLCSTAALKAWDRIQELEKRVESYLRVKQSEREPFSDFLQRLTKAIQIRVTDSVARCIINESLAYENVNIECKWILGPLKIRSPPMDEWVLHTMNVETLDYGIEVWVGKAISNGRRSHQNSKCFNCGRMGHMRKNCRQHISRNNTSSRNGRIGGLSLQVYVGGVAKADIGQMNVGQ